MISTLACSLLLLALEPQMVEMDVLNDQEPVGSARIGYELSTAGDKIARFELSLERPKTRTMQETTWSATGKPKRILYSRTVEGQERISMTVDFSTGTHTATRTTEQSQTTINLAAREGTENPAEFWFISSKPALGAKHSYWTLQFPNLEWVRHSIEYKGLTTHESAGETLLHHVTIDDQNVYYDDLGLPWRIEAGAYTLQRKGIKVVSGLK